ncbi:type II toxin-antitoxin system RelE/ParE family toxin [Pseudomonas fontis]|uniref:Type II toxin-antitoxin system RelE/ParE family toxin n=1 Tax=Pseudomonas fontis TaxID=2942633 RepID=A0ABT5NST2_9PSED|nr:type II toxin-antitoxin system RelE/ParE family toxin [Pseudomonas fontis]MDD0975228.1 type II toxin-antitoxin system RelE/ParE family toxin [Pseudomonas fontis]MDD0991230.1 type II toxin-antitoxin system RelE/ParE family toxin [Pseudomonas fontis]
MIYTIEQTQRFRSWLEGMRDLRAKIAIGRRLERASVGNLGDVRCIGEGVSEMRLDTGPGYRVYFTVRTGVVIVLLAGGDKSSQAADIRLARSLAKEV